MILYKLKSDLQFDFIIKLGKMALNIVGTQGNRKKQYPKILLLPYIILAMELLVYVDTF